VLKLINVPAGGLVIYGGFIGAVTGFIVFVRKHRLPLLPMADLVAPSFMIGLAIGRVGCFLNGCCYGGQTDWPWAVQFPAQSPPYSDQAGRGEMHGFRIESRDGKPAVVTRVDSNSSADAAGLKQGDEIVAIVASDEITISSHSHAKSLLGQAFEAKQSLRLKLRSGETVEIPPVVPPPPRSRPVHPAQLYSAIDAGLLAWLLWSYFPFRRRDGEVVALMLTIHPVTRFLLEYIRTDEPAVFGTELSISQNISIVLLACAGLMWWQLSRQPRGVVWPLVAVGPPSRGGPEHLQRSKATSPAPSTPSASTNNARSSRPRRSPK
jgi:phosphatidylglycerol:prolipoprotein diacylglycerol transferase